MTHKPQAALRHLQNLFSFTFLPDSLRKQLDLISSERSQPYFAIAFTLWLVGGVEIIQKMTGQRLDPRFWMLIAIVITAYSGVRIFRLSPSQSTLRNRKQSAAADAMVNGIVSRGFTVYRGRASEKGSNSYVAVGRGGVYAMEVKARNVFGSRTIELRKQDELLLGGRISDSRPLRQAQAAAQKIRQRLEGVSNLQTAVKPMVVFLDDWRVEPSTQTQDVAVIRAGDLQEFLDRQQAVFSESEVEEISTRLADQTLAAAC